MSEGFLRGFEAGGARRSPVREEKSFVWAGLESSVRPELPPAERIRALARHASAESAAFQSVVMANLQIISRVLKTEQAAARAAISLAHQEKLQEMKEELEETASALRQTLSSKGSRMLDASPPAPGTGESDERLWWFALTEAIDAVEGGIDTAAGIVAGQPKGGASRLLSSVVARQLRRHQNQLLSEAEHWIG